MSQSLPEHARPFLDVCTFLRSVTRLEDFPPGMLPEVAFIGRSNVGKSSLINALFNRRRLARTSNTPGRTQQLNLFQASDTFYFVDMPGYGYAQAPRYEVQKWQDLSWAYLQERQRLKRVFVLIDSRHGLKDNDKEFMKALDTIAVPYQIVLTKADKVGQKAALNCKLEVENALTGFTAVYPEVLLTSTVKKAGIDEVRNAILRSIKSL